MRKQIPPFCNVIHEFLKDPNSEHLRLGQWFYNEFLSGGVLTSDIESFADRLHAEQDFYKCKEMILKMYTDYQWPMI